MLHLNLPPAIRCLASQDPPCTGNGPKFIPNPVNTPPYSNSDLKQTPSIVICNIWWIYVFSFHPTNNDKGRLSQRKLTTWFMKLSLHRKTQRWQKIHIQARQGAFSPEEIDSLVHEAELAEDDNAGVSLTARYTNCTSVSSFFLEIMGGKSFAIFQQRSFVNREIEG